MITLAVGISGPIIDSWFLSRVSDDAAAGVGATLPVFVLLQTMLNAMGQAGASIAGQYLGARRPRLADATFTLMISLLACGGLVLGALLSLSPRGWCALGLRGEIAGHSVEFLRIIGAGFVGRALIAGLTNLLAARGLTLWNLGVSIAIVGLNVLFNMLLVGRLFGLPCFGVQGVALATVLVVGNRQPGHAGLGGAPARFSSLVVASGPGLEAHSAPPCSHRGALGGRAHRLPAFSSGAGQPGRSPRHVRPHRARVRRQPGQPSCSLQLWTGIRRPDLGFALVGARDFATAHRRLKAAVAWGAGLSFVSSLVLAASGHWLLGLFSRDAGIVALGALLLWVDVLVQPAKAANIAITFSLRAAGDSRFPAIVGSTLMWTVGIGSAFALAFGAGWGVAGIWLGMAIDEWTRAVVNGWRWKSGAWQSKGVT
jgi:Na+-driven multidrug efflux pump